MSSNNNTHIKTHIGPMTDEIIEGLINEFNKKKIKDKIVKHMIDPIICDIAEKYYPHIITVIIILALLILLMISILIISLIPIKTNNNK